MKLLAPTIASGDRSHPIRRTFVACLSSLLCVGFFAASPSIGAADLTANYVWNPVKIGGATYFTTFWMSPTVPGLVYVKADTAGPLRWDATAQKWINVTTADTMPQQPNGYYTGLPVALSIAGAPSDSNLVYQAVQDNQGGSTTGNVYRSSNQGASWTQAGSLNVFLNANGESRDSGPRLAVDPADANVVYFGTQRAGLYLTTDGGTNWSQVSAVPVPTDTKGGVTAVAIDLNSGTLNGRTKKIYAAVQGSGIWMSADAGGTWTNTGGLTAVVHTLKIGSDGVVYAVQHDGDVQKYVAGSWSSILPSGVTTIRTLAVDPQNAQRLLIIHYFGDDPYISTNQGTSWTQLTRHNGTLYPWQSQFYKDRGGYTQVGDLQFDITDSNKVWAAEAYGLWQGVISSGTITWNTISAGSEGTASQAIVKPPGGSVMTGQMDLGIFRHTDPDAYTSLQITSSTGDNYTEGWSVAYCASQPSFVAGISAPGNSYAREESGYSTQGGAQGTWVKFTTVPGYKTSTPTGIAISATSPDNIVIYDGSQNNVYVTKDRGASWTTTSLGTPMNAWWGPGHGGIVADKVNGGTFYVYDWSNGDLWRSTDSGDTWVIASTTLHQGSWCNIQSVPGKAGHLLWSGGVVGGTELPLYRSTDFGSTWTAASTTGLARAAAAGAAAPGASYPTIYFYGKVGGVEGMWRSIDNAQSWDKIANVAPMGIYQPSYSMDADPSVFGAVYVTLNGTGSAWGQFIAPADGTYRIIAAHSGKVLDVAGSGTANNTNVQQYTYHSGSNQKWQLTSLGDGKFKIIGVQSGRSLDAYASGGSGTNVEIWDYHSGTNQEWLLIPTSGGRYRISPVYNTQLALDVKAASTSDGANVQVYTWNGGTNQQWYFQAP